MISSPTVVITAGGAATRCGSGAPKALMQTRSTTYLEVLLNEVNTCGFRDIVIYCNRPSHLSRIEEVSREYCDPTLIVDHGANSTFQLARHAASICDSKDILFLYGHAPHPASHLRSIATHHAEMAVSLFESSSKKHPIRLSRQGCIEPPYKIATNLLHMSDHDSWNDFFDECNELTRYLKIDAPSEFNFVHERGAFEEYVQSWFKKWHAKALNANRFSHYTPSSVG